MSASTRYERHLPPAWRSLWLNIAGGAAAGLIIVETFVYSMQITPVVFYALFALGGAIYGAAAGIAVKMQVPAFGRGDILRYAALVATGFVAGSVLALELNKTRLVAIQFSVIYAPPLIGAACGHLSRRWIAEAGDFPLHLGKPGWMLGAVVYIPMLYFSGILIVSSLRATIFPSGYSYSLEPILMLAGAVGGAVGGWVSGAITRTHIRTGFAWQARQDRGVNRQRVQGGDVLDVVEDRDGDIKLKGKPKAIDLPLPQTARQWQMAALVAVVVAVGTGIFFTFLPARVVQIVVTPTLFPTPAPYPTVSSSASQAALFSVGQPVEVFNLTPDVADYADWWVTRTQWLPVEQAWIYEVATANGITLMRAENQLAPRPALPTPPLLPTTSPARQIARYGDGRAALVLAQRYLEFAAGTAVRVETYYWNPDAGGWLYLVETTTGARLWVPEDGLRPAVTATPYPLPTPTFVIAPT